eukprot:CAMPEP_0172528234 /NCGR_PEP_ID=MMETSP1067-20121228/2685_1 /TAXON_ID=265564 ORGANISM="Thalassiosira punctigera, Strain Tpunct2005C2" /NCGR_SAMPLE_ID=MMETSP1067 /ASSEMBLY_ACC=CAM_ASM_000444 /LENGTH=815 /DNA_ID=CAMNT_0013312113 /DNA_START=186 /DNA_END=2633 /DNA_ORIENTATION=+
MANSLLELRTKYDDFLREERFSYAERISTAVDDHVRRGSRGGSGGKGPSPDAAGGVGGSLVGHPRLRVPLSDLRSHDPRLSNALLRDPLRHIRALEAAAHDIALEERPGYDKDHVRMRVALGGPIGSRAIGPRELGSSSLRRLVCVEGVAVKVSSVKPKVVQSVHYCPATRAHEARSYVDATDPELGLPQVDASGRELPDKVVQLTSSSYPTQDKEGHALETEFGLSVYKDHQTITLQEMPERAPMGQLPRSVDLILDHDLVDKVKPGDRVQVVGVYRALSSASSGQRSTSGVFPTAVLANDVRILGRDSHGLVFTTNDVRTIRSLGKRPDILDILGRSVCPSIHGHDVIKKALALQLLSGCEKNLANGTHLRGDINILMVGDPSTAKSQLLRSAMGIAPLAVSTTGKGSSGVGLTAAVTSDPETRERRLEAGAMVLADRGLVCVDEFDKMGENDRVAIHEAMEQQTVTIAKAGMHASLNARCSVLAAANPVYGQYDRKRRVQENIGLPDSLLSRFDLLFVVLDQMDPENDRRIAAHVIRGHRYQNAQGGAGHDSDYDDDDDETSDEEEEGGDVEKAHAVWSRSRYDTNNLSGVCPGAEDDDPHSDDVLQHEFLRKYLHFAKTRMKPVLTEEARECIAGRYAEMRSRQDERTLPVTARSLETIIRLASAHAKARLSNVVEADPDVAAAMDILGFALYHENNKVVENPNDPASALGQKRHREEPDLTDASDLEDHDAQRQRVEEADASSSPIVQEDALADLKQTVFAEVSKSLEDSVNVDDVCVHVEDRALVLQAIQSLEEESRVMMSDGEIYLID